MFDIFYTPKLDDERNCKFTVYDIRCDKNGYPHFLIYVDGQWKYVSAKHCKLYLYQIIIFQII